MKQSITGHLGPLLGALLGATLSVATSADDTDIYLKPPASADAKIRPNVLFVLDTSSSMTSYDGTGVTRLDRMKQALREILNQANNVNVGLMRFHSVGGPVLYPLANIDADVSSVEATGSEGSADVLAAVATGADDGHELIDGTVVLDADTVGVGTVVGPATGVTVETRVERSVDDVEEDGVTGNLYYNSSDLELVNDGNAQPTGIRFQGVDVPQGATITSAEIEFKRDEAGYNITTLSISAEIVPDAPGFDNVPFGVSSRIKVGAPSAAWDGNNADGSNPPVGAKLVTPDLKALVQAIVDQSAWEKENAMVFFVTGTGRRTVESYDGDQGGAPLLRIEYESAPVLGQSVAALRFEEVLVPQGATIDSARIEFEGAAVQSASAEMRLRGHDSDNSPPLDAARSALSSRMSGEGTSAEVGWPSVEEWNNDAKHLTPDLAPILQEIVDRSGWCGGNAMTLFTNNLLSASLGMRSAKSADRGLTTAPKLRVNFTLPANPLPGTGCSRQLVSSRVAASVDDAEERVSGGYISLNSSDLEIVDDGGDRQTIGLRFQDIQVAAGAEILEAWIEFTAKNDSNSDQVDAEIAIQNIDDAASFSTTRYNISSRATIESVSWPIDETWVEGRSYLTPDLAASVRAVVQRPGWQAGNSMAFVITGDQNERKAWSANGQAAVAPVLKVRYTGVASTGSGSPALTVRERLRQIVAEIAYKSGTPIVDTLYEAALYFQGLPVDYGKVRGDQGSHAEFTRVSHPASYNSDDPGVALQRPAGCTSDDLNSTACISEEITGPAVYINPVTAACQANYLVLLSDGEPYNNHSGDKIRQMTGDSSCGSTVPNGQCGPELVRYLRDEKDISTYTIGFNIPSTAIGTTYLKELANDGDGQYYPATSAGDLVSVFQAILIEALSRPTSYSAPSLSVSAFNKFEHRGNTYFSLFKPSSKQRWDGNVKKYRLCVNSVTHNCAVGDILDADNKALLGADNRIQPNTTSLWSSIADGSEVTEGGAEPHTPAPSARRVYTYTGNTDTPAVPATLTQVLDSNSTVSKELLGDASMSNDSRTEIINWLRGQDVRDEDGDGSTSDPRYRFGAPLHGSAVTWTYGMEDGDASKDITKVFVATNDGGIRMLNDYDGTEEWIFYPPQMLAKQADLIADPSGAQVHGLDATPTLWTYDHDGSGTFGDNDQDFVRLIVGMRRGGQNYYALDVTPNAALASQGSTSGITPKLMWIVRGGQGDFANLAQSWSQPRVTTVRIWDDVNSTVVDRSVVVFGGGYDDARDATFGTSVGDGNAIYIVDAVTGARVWWASNAGSGPLPGSGANLELAGMDYAIPSDLTLLDADRDGRTDRIYVTDVGGQLWRIDLGAALGAFADVSSGAILADLSGDPGGESGARRVFYPPSVTRMRDPKYSDTARFDAITVTTGERANPLGKLVHDRVYVIRDYGVTTRIASNFEAVETSDLYDATSNVLQDGEDADEVEEALDDLREAKGWYIDLRDPDSADWVGEKGLSRPITVAGNLFFTTYLPDFSSNDPCTPVEGGGRLWGLDLRNGSAAYDWQGTDDALTRADRARLVGSGIPSAVSPLFVVNEVPSDTPDTRSGLGTPGVLLMVGVSEGGVVIDPDIPLPAGATFWRIE